MIDTIWLWVGFNVFILAMLALGLGLFRRKSHVVSLRESLRWTFVWVALALGFYIYAVAGIHLFGKADSEHFGSLGSALLSLFRMVILDNCGDIFNAQLAQVPAIKVVIFFITFIVFGTMIILNLFIGSIMNRMSEMHAEIESRDRNRHVAETGAATIDDDLRQLERQLESLKEHAVRVRHRLGQTAPAPLQVDFESAAQATKP